MEKDDKVFLEWDFWNKAASGQGDLDKSVRDNNEDVLSKDLAWQMPYDEKSIQSKHEWLEEISFESFLINYQVVVGSAIDFVEQSSVAQFYSCQFLTQLFF